MARYIGAYSAGFLVALVVAIGVIAIGHWLSIEVRVFSGWMSGIAFIEVRDAMLESD